MQAFAGEGTKVSLKTNVLFYFRGERRAELLAPVKITRGRLVFITLRMQMVYRI